MRVTTGGCVPARLPTFEVWEQSLDCRHNVIGSCVRPSSVFRLLIQMLLACLLINPYRFAIAMPFVESQMVFDSFKLAGRFHEGGGGVELILQSPPSGIGQQVKLEPPRQPETVTIVEMRAEKCTRGEYECAASERMRQIKNMDRVEQDSALMWLAFNFFGGVFTSLLYGFVMNAKKYGINIAWRGLVLDWPIPYWMRFVPKHEQDL